MILWTIQSPQAVAALERRGVLLADHGAVEPSFRPAYAWMAGQMSRRIGSSPNGARPLWAWQAWTAKHPRPDLRSTGHLPRGHRGARIAFTAEPSAIVLSDFFLWHYVLNYWYLPASLRDSAAFEAQVRRSGLDVTSKPLSEPALHSRIEASWDRIFALTTFIRGVTEGRAARSIQATFWSLPLQAVQEITWFTAR